jgi:hypothetical protein
MPVTIKVANHPANKSHFGGASSSKDLLLRAKYMNTSDLERIIQTSLADNIVAAEQITPRANGLVFAAYEAYSRHHHLIIRPEDVWFAIISQFSFYVNGNAENLRNKFVRHRGKKGLIVKSEGLRDYAVFCKSMTNLLEENIVDPKLRKWVLPSFTTTTKNDEVIGSVLMVCDYP